MKSIDLLLELYRQFYKPSEQAKLKTAIEENHQELIASISKVDRSKVLKIIDHQSLIGTLHSEESFIYGLKLGINLMNELATYKPEDFKLYVAPKEETKINEEDE